MEIANSCKHIHYFFVFLCFLQWINACPNNRAGLQRKEPLTVALKLVLSWQWQEPASVLPNKYPGRFPRWLQSYSALPILLLSQWCLASPHLAMLLPFTFLLGLAATLPTSTRLDTDTFLEHLLAFPDVDAIFDYIVVGGGTAGVTIAARLAEHQYRVALIEAGGIYEALSLTATIPGADSLGVGSDVSSSSLIDWRFVTHKVPGANYRDVHYPRGKCLGGSYGFLCP